MSEPDRTILGIDIGVTGITMAAFDEDGRTRIVPNADGDDRTPACLHIYDVDGVVVGAEAVKMAALEPENVVSDVPWRLGEVDWHPRIQGREWTAQELFALVLRKLREDASELRGADIRRAVLAVPAWYDSARRNATVESARIAGLEVLSLVNQPLAAALGVDAQELPEDGPVVVFDMGGRDLEVTVLDKVRDTLTVSASQVRYDLCMRAFELRIRQVLVEHYRAQTAGATHTEDEMLAQQVVDASHNALEALFHRETAPLRLRHAGVDARMQIDRTTFGIKTAPLLLSAIALIDEVLAEAGHTSDQTVACVAVGRGVRMHNVQRALQDRFGERLLMPSDPDLCIARGAARLAVLRHDRRHPGMSARPIERERTADVHHPSDEDEAPVADPGFRAAIGLADGGHVEPSDDAIRDATTRDLGVIALGRDRKERVYTLIPKGTPIPCEVTGRFTYAYPGMTGVRVEVTEGKGARRSQVQVIGVVELRGLPPRPVGTPIEILYVYGIDQILKVQVVDVDTGIRRDVDLTFRGELSTMEIRQATERSDTIHLD